MYMFYQHVVTMNPSACDSGNQSCDRAWSICWPQLAWVPVWSAVLGFCLQDLASVGLASGQDLAQLVREHYPRWCVRSLYICLELAVVAADIQEVRESTQSLSRHHNQTRLRLTKSVCLHGQVIGTAIALNLLLGLPLWMGSLFTAVLSMVLVFLHDSHSTLFEALIAVALCVTSMCAIGMMLFGGVDSGALLTGLIIPSAPPETALIVVGTIGATVMPHNIFLGSRLLLDKRTMSDAEECGTKSEDHEQAPTNQPKVVGVRAAPRSWHRIINFSRCELAFALVVSLFCNAGLISTFSRAAYSPTCLGGDEPLGCIANGVSTPGDGGDACVIQQINVAGQCGTIDLQNAGGSLEASMPPELGAGAKVLWAVYTPLPGTTLTLLRRSGDHGRDAAAEGRALDASPHHPHGRSRASSCYCSLRFLRRRQIRSHTGSLRRRERTAGNSATVRPATRVEIFIRHCSRWRVRLGPLHTYICVACDDRHRGLLHPNCRRLRARYGDARSVGRIRPYPFGLPGAMHAARMERSRHVLQIQRLDHYSDVRSGCDRFVP